jgi:hypothetical protein
LVEKHGKLVEKHGELGELFPVGRNPAEVGSNPGGGWNYFRRKLIEKRKRLVESLPEAPIRPTRVRLSRSEYPEEKNFHHKGQQYTCAEPLLSAVFPQKNDPTSFQKQSIPYV